MHSSAKFSASYEGTLQAYGSSASDLDVVGKAVGDRLFFAGEATNSADYGTVHAAYTSGIRAAGEVRAATGP